MTIERQRNVIHRQPFEPVVLPVADAREVIVRHPDFIAVSPGGRTVHVFRSTENAEWFDLRPVTGIEARRGARCNGRRRA